MQQTQVNEGLLLGNITNTSYTINTPSTLMADGATAKVLPSDFAGVLNRAKEVSFNCLLSMPNNFMTMHPRV